MIIRLEGEHIKVLETFVFAIEEISNNLSGDEYAEAARDLLRVIHQYFTGLLDCGDPLLSNDFCGSC